MRFLLPLLLLATPVAASELPLHIEAEAPRSYVYRNAFGEAEHYLAIHYRVINRGDRVLRFHGLPVAVTASGSDLNDGFRPLVQAAFCEAHGCERDCRSTAELQGVSIAPRDHVRGVALFPIRSIDVPQSLRVRAGNGAAVEVRRAEGRGWTASATSIASTRPVVSSPPAPARVAARSATAPSADDAHQEEAPRPWTVVRAGIPSLSEIGR